MTHRAGPLGLFEYQWDLDLQQFSLAQPISTPPLVEFTHLSYFLRLFRERAFSELGLLFGSPFLVEPNATGNQFFSHSGAPF
jgi:hypothetical protein